MSIYSPDKQATFASNKVSLYKKTIPTIRDLNTKYGDVAISLWLNPQIANLAMFCNISSLINEHTIKELSIILTHSFSFLRLSELMKFFYDCKAGLYGKIFSPMDITIALRQYVKERVVVYED